MENVSVRKKIAPIPLNLARTESVSIRQKIENIAIEISWAELSRQYFGKSSSWMYHKIDGVDGNGIHKGFTDEELQQLKGALCDLSDRIRKVADGL